MISVKFIDQETIDRLKVKNVSILIMSKYKFDFKNRNIVAENGDKIEVENFSYFENKLICEKNISFCNNEYTFYCFMDINNMVNELNAIDYFNKMNNPMCNCDFFNRVFMVKKINLSTRNFVEDNSRFLNGRNYFSCLYKEKYEEVIEYYLALDENEMTTVQIDYLFDEIVNNKNHKLELISVEDCMCDLHSLDIELKTRYKLADKTFYCNSSNFMQKVFDLDVLSNCLEDYNGIFIINAYPNKGINRRQFLTSAITSSSIKIFDAFPIKNRIENIVKIYNNTRPIHLGTLIVGEDKIKNTEIITFLIEHMFISGLNDITLYLRLLDNYNNKGEGQHLKKDVLLEKINKFFEKDANNRRYEIFYKLNEVKSELRTINDELTKAYDKKNRLDKIIAEGTLPIPIIKNSRLDMIKNVTPNQISLCYDGRVNVSYDFKDFLKEEKGKLYFEIGEEYDFNE